MNRQFKYHLGCKSRSSELKFLYTISPLLSLPNREENRECSTCSLNTLHGYLSTLSAFHCKFFVDGTTKGPYIKDARKIFGILDPLPPLSAFWLDL